MAEEKRYVRPHGRPPAIPDERKRWEVVAIFIGNMGSLAQQDEIEKRMNDGWSWLGTNNSYIYMTKYLGR